MAALRYLPDHGQHRRVDRVLGAQRRRGVLESRPRHHTIGLRPPRRQGGAERHIGAALLVAGMHRTRRAGAVHRIEKFVILHPRQAEQRLDPIDDKPLDQHLGGGFGYHELLSLAGS